MDSPSTGDSVYIIYVVDTLVDPPYYILQLIEVAIDSSLDHKRVANEFHDLVELVFIMPTPLVLIVSVLPQTIEE